MQERKAVRPSSGARLTDFEDLQPAELDAGTDQKFPADYGFRPTVETLVQRPYIDEFPRGVPRLRQLGILAFSICPNDVSWLSDAGTCTDQYKW